MRDKHHVIEKTVIKDTRVCDIVDNAQDRVQRYMLEIEILPNSEYDTPNRYIVSFATKQDKDTWLDAYKSLVKMAVKTKNLQDISMTVTKMDQQDEDDQVEPGSPTKEQEKPSDMRTRFEQLELQYDQALAKIKHLEQQLDTVSKQPSVGQSDPLLEQKSLEMQQDLTSKQSVIDQLQQDMALKQNALDQLKTQLESKQGDLERLLQEKQTLNEQLDQKATGLMVAC
ncbi:hypothetical protein EDD86DRAFT_216802 [Gorgonomyces haynaldii]|nr:hypothetical protein EDD86DRAFT_216802 [Gorgonomyces haynaldii]